MGELNAVHELQLIETLLAQVGSQCRGDDDVPFIVILHARKNPEAESLFESLTWRKRVKLIHGDGMNESDMRRAGVARARSIFLLSDRTQGSAQQADAEVSAKAPETGPTKQTHGRGSKRPKNVTVFAHAHRKTGALFLSAAFRVQAHLVSHGRVGLACAALLLSAGCVANLGDEFLRTRCLQVCAANASDERETV